MDFRLVMDIEQELGPLPQLAEKFLNGGWSLTELVTLRHIMLQAEGSTVDFMELGQRMTGQGFATDYALARQKLFRFLPPVITVRL
ncbi:MAG: hypothetical protein PW788_02575 [Micavibrio sp.]|nr:hypothetical protein [Micavibrio sp.]